MKYNKNILQKSEGKYFTNIILCEFSVNNYKYFDDLTFIMNLSLVLNRIQLVSEMSYSTIGYGFHIV